MGSKLQRLMVNQPNQSHTHPPHTTPLPPSTQSLPSSSSAAVVTRLLAPQSQPLSLIMWASSMMNLPSLYFWLLSKACSWREWQRTKDKRGCVYFKCNSMYMESRLMQSFQFCAKILACLCSWLRGSWLYNNQSLNTAEEPADPKPWPDCTVIPYIGRTESLSSRDTKWTQAAANAGQTLQAKACFSSLGCVIQNSSGKYEWI